MEWGDHGWAFDLVARDEAARHRAVRRFEALDRAAEEPWRENQQLLAHRGPVRPTDPGYAGLLAATAAEAERAGRLTLFAPIDGFQGGDPAGAPFALLLLRWEALHPDEWWQAMRSRRSWTHKEFVLGSVARHGIPAELRPELAELVVLATRRRYRCRDWQYAGAARHAEGEELRRALRAEDDPRARFLEHVLDHPGINLNRRSYGRWLAEPWSLWLPADLDRRAWDVELRGWFGEAVLRHGGSRYRLTFADPARLAGQVEAELGTGAFHEPNLVFVPAVTREAMAHAADRLVRTGAVARLTPVARGRANPAGSGGR